MLRERESNVSMACRVCIKIRERVLERVGKGMSL